METITRAKAILFMDESELAEFLSDFYFDIINDNLKFEDDSDIENWLSKEVTELDGSIAKVASYMSDSGVV